MAWYAPTSGGTEYYAYGPDNMRVWKKTPSGNEEVYFYGAQGEKLGRFYYGTGVFTTVRRSLYFGARRLDLLDRLGSVRDQSGYYPYGEEYPTTAQDRDKFATYYRDGTSLLDYARNRYYSSTLGRFMSADPSTSNALLDPGQWNKYAYVGNDPVNWYDPSGLDLCAPGTYCMGMGFNPGGSSPFTGSSGMGGSGLRGSPVFEAPPDFQEGKSGGSLPSDWRLLPGAVARAIQALTLNSDCMALFGNATTREGKFNPVNVLTSLFLSNNGEFGKVTFGAMSGNDSAITKPTGLVLPVWPNDDVVKSTSVSITINNGPTDPGTWNNGNAAVDAEILLHELGHAYNFLIGSGGSLLYNAKERTDPTVNDRIIARKCNLPYR